MVPVTIKRTKVMNRRRCAMPGNQAVTVHCSSKNSDPSGFMELKKSSLSFYQMQQMGLLLGQKFDHTIFKNILDKICSATFMAEALQYYKLRLCHTGLFTIVTGSFIFPKTLFLLCSLPFLFGGSPVLLCNENHLLFNI